MFLLLIHTMLVYTYLAQLPQKERQEQSGRETASDLAGDILHGLMKIS